MCNLDISNMRGNEKTMIYREIRYTVVQFIKVIPVLLRYIEVHNTVCDYLCNAT